MKIFKYLSIIFIVFIVSIVLYNNFIYYIIPYNPFNSFSENEIESFYIDKYNTDNSSEYIVSNDVDNNKLIFQYFKNLKLKPIKSNKIEKEIKVDNLISGGFKFGSPSYDHILINDISLKNPSSFYISFNNDSFKNKTGYYQIIDDKFDYNYINHLIDDNQEKE